MKLIQYEFIKIIQKRSLIIFLVILCFVNIGIFAYVQNLDTTIPPSSYHQLQTDLASIPNHQRYEYIKTEYEKYQGFLTIEQLTTLRLNVQDNQYMIDSILSDFPDVEEKYGKLYKENHQPVYTKDLESEALFLENILNEFQKLHDYPSYIENIQAKAHMISQISIFHKENSIEEKNIQKTANDYQSRINTPITYECEKGISSILSFPITSLMIILAMMVIASSLTIDEKEKKLFSIIKITPKGQYQTMFAKCVVMFLIIGVITICMMVSELLYASYIYGLGNLSRSVQSLAQFYQCPYSLTVIEFIGLFIFIKWLAACLIGTLMLLCAIVFKNKITTMVLMIFIMAIEYGLYLTISPLDSLYLLKYFNLFSILQTDTFFQIYRNIDVFHQLISLQALTFIGLVCLLLIMVVLTTMTYHYKRNMRIQNIEIKNFKHFSFPSLSLFQQECYKIFFIQKVFILCLLCIVVQCYQYHYVPIYQDSEEIIYQQYMKELEGPLTNEKEQWLLKLRKHYDNLNQQSSLISQKEKKGLISHSLAITLQQEISQQQIGEQSFQKVFQQYLDIQKNPQKQFVYPMAYQQYFIETTWTFMPTLLLCLFLLMSMSHVMSYEYQNHANLVTQLTLKGRKPVLKIKLGLSLLIGFIFLVMTMFPSLFLLQQKYGFASLSASATSIQDFAIFPSWISIGMICLASFVLKILAVIFIIVIIHVVGVKTKNHLLTLFMSTAFLLMPMILSYGGYHVLDAISLYPLFFAGQYISSVQGLMQIVFSLLGYGILSVLGLRYLFAYYQNV